MPEPTAEILVLGDEILRGIVRDTSSAWLTARLSARGWLVRRITALPDDVQTMAREVAAWAVRDPALLVTTGGLGPTYDDRTLEAVGLALGRPLAEDPEALDLIAARYADLVPEAPELTPERRKMARLPSGSVMIPNPVGTAPGGLLRLDDRMVVSLPGVPAEMQAMWPVVEEVLTDVFGTGAASETTVVLDVHDESAVAAFVAEVAKRHTGVYVKSRAAGSGDGLRVTLSATGEDGARAVDAALQDLRRTLDMAGVSVRAQGGAGG